MGQHVVIDGDFSRGEWDDALSFPISSGYDIYVKADSQVVSIGIRSPVPVVIGVCEIRVTENNKDVYLLHVSGGLGEGFSGFPAGTEYEIGHVKDWEANLSVEDATKLDAWVAAGRPIDRYDEVAQKVYGKEFKIQRKMLSGDRVKITLGFIEIEDTGMRRYVYPANRRLDNADNWWS
jgi:hypothetical protein